MNPKVLPREAWIVTRKLARAGLLESWVLAGGTGLALQLGHRISIDMSFFSITSFDSQMVRAEAAKLGRVTVQSQDADTLHLQLDGVRLSFLRSEAPFLFPPIEYRNLAIADVRDIAAMKIVAAGGRGSRKDFIDLYAYLEAGGDFGDLMEILRLRYASTTFNEVHLLKSLVYFEDAEQEPMPRMLTGIDWTMVKSRLEDEVRRWAP